MAYGHKHGVHGHRRFLTLGFGQTGRRFERFLISVCQVGLMARAVAFIRPIIINYEKASQYFFLALEQQILHFFLVH